MVNRYEFQEVVKQCWGLETSLTDVGLTLVANVALATGPTLLQAPRSSVIKLIYFFFRFFSV